MNLSSPICLLLGTLVMEPGTEDSDEETMRGGEEQPDVSTTPSAEVLELVALAQRWREREALSDALELMDQAIERNPEAGSLYLMRAQIHLEIGQSGSGDSTHLAGALDDLDRYLEIEPLDQPTRQALLARRDELAAQLREARQPEEDERAEPLSEPAVEPRPSVVGPVVGPVVEPVVDRPARTSAVWWYAAGGALSIAAAGAGANALRIERQCEVGCAVRWGVEVPSTAVAASSSVVASGLAVAGTVALARTDPRATRRFTIAAGALASLALVTGTVTAALAGAGWSRVRPSDGARLSSVQSLANASSSAFMIALPLTVSTVTGSISLLFGTRRQGVAGLRARRHGRL